MDVAAASTARGLYAVSGDLDDLRGQTLAVSQTWVFDAGKGLGDTVRAVVDGRTVRLRIVAVVSDAPDLYGDLLVPEDLVAEQLRDLDPDLAFVVPGDSIPVDTARTSIEHSLAGTHSRLLTSEAWIDQVDQETRAANNVGLWVLLGPAGLYAGIAIVNAILIGASQRRRQLRVVRLLGATREQVRRMAVWEAGLVGGLVTGFVGWLVRRATTADVADVAMTVPWLPLTGVVVTCAGLAVVAALVGARRALR